MSEDKTSKDDLVVQLDVYGVKVKLKPDEIGEEQLSSWSDVGRRVNRHLMSLAAGLVGFVDEVVLAARSIVRGIAKFPDAISSKRIGRAHEVADQLEYTEQLKIESGEMEHKTPAEARKNLENSINKQRVKGNYATIQSLGEGRWLITVVRPEAGELVTALAQQALLQAGNPGVEDDKE